MNDPISITNEMWNKNALDMASIKTSVKEQAKDIKRLSHDLNEIKNEMKSLTTLLQTMINTYATKTEIELLKKNTADTFVNRIEWTEHCATSTVAIENAVKSERELEALHKRLDKIDLRYAKLTAIWAVVATVLTFVLNNIPKIVDFFK